MSIIASTYTIQGIEAYKASAKKLPYTKLSPRFDPKLGYNVFDRVKNDEDLWIVVSGRYLLSKRTKTWHVTYEGHDVWTFALTKDVALALLSEIENKTIRLP